MAVYGWSAVSRLVRHTIRLVADSCTSFWQYEPSLLEIVHSLRGERGSSPCVLSLNTAEERDAAATSRQPSACRRCTEDWARVGRGLDYGSLLE